jgi:hypothetical protein
MSVAAAARQVLNTCTVFCPECPKTTHETVAVEFGRHVDDTVLPWQADALRARRRHDRVASTSSARAL